MQLSEHTNPSECGYSAWEKAIECRTRTEQSSQPIRHPSNVINYAVAGQSVRIDSQMLAPLQESIDIGLTSYSLTQIENHQHIIRAFWEKGLIHNDDIESLCHAVRVQDRKASDLLSTIIENGIEAISRKIEKRIDRLFPNQNRGFKKANKLRYLDLFVLGVYTDDHTQPELLIENSDFLQHIDSGLLDLPSKNTQILYRKILNQLTKYSGIWQTDLTESHWRECWTPTVAIEVERVAEFIASLSVENVNQVIEEYEKSEASEFIYSLSEEAEMCGYAPETQDFAEWYIECAKSEQAAGLARYNARKLDVKADTLSEFKQYIELKTPLDKQLYSILEFTFTELTMLPSNTLSSFINKEEEAHFLGFVIQEQANNDMLNQSSQETYEHYMNAGEACESYTIDFDNKGWVDDIVDFGTAMGIIQKTIVLVTDSLPEAQTVAS